MLAVGPRAAWASSGCTPLARSVSRMKGHEDGGNVLWTGGRKRELSNPPWSLERRWSSRRFPYGYLVTTSPQSLIPPWLAASLAG